MEKILSILASVTLTATSSTVVIPEFQTGTQAREKLIDVIKETKVDGNIANTVKNVLIEILVSNSNSGVKSIDVDLKDFVAAEIGKAGSARLVAKENNHFEGEVLITITPLKIRLVDKLTNLTLDGNKAWGGFTAVDELLKMNPNSGVKVSDIEIIEFIAPKISENGRLKIIAKEESKFFGSVIVNILSLK